jgi:hypothetical protein
MPLSKQIPQEAQTDTLNGEDETKQLLKIINDNGKYKENTTTTTITSLI